MPVTEREPFHSACGWLCATEDPAAMALSCPVLPQLEVSLQVLAKRNGKCLFQTDAMFILFV